VLFLVAGFFALIMAVGYRTRLATFLSWFLLVSLHARNPMILQGGDDLLRNLLFWSNFLPLGAYYSIDSCRRSSDPKLPLRVVSMGTAAYMLQVCFVYWFTSIHKLSPNSFPVWWEKGLAVYHALSIDQFTKPLGYFLLSFPMFLLRCLDYAVILFEIFGPFLLLMPVFNDTFRMLGILGFVSLHLGFGLSLALGPFPWVSSFAMLPFLPTSFWEWLLPRLRRFSPWVRRLSFIPDLKPFRGVVDRIANLRTSILSPERSGFFRLSLPGNLLAGVFLIYILSWNLSNVGFKHKLLPKMEWLGRLTGAEQYWPMFSPPLIEDGWYVIPGTLKNGKEVDLFKGGGSVRWEKPANVRTTYKNERWRKYMNNLLIKKHADYRLYYAKYLCRDWNSRRQGDEQLDRFEIIYMREDTLPNKRTAPPVKLTLWKHWCFKMPEDISPSAPK
jgi:hypothetical protein